MKIKLEKDDYLEVRLDIDKKIIFSIRASKDDSTAYLVSAKLDTKDLDAVIAELISLKAKVS